GTDSAKHAFDSVICTRFENESSSVFITGCPSSSSLRRTSVSRASSIAVSASGSTHRTRDQSFVKRTTALSGRPASRSSTPIFTNSFFTGSGTYRTRENSHGCRPLTLSAPAPLASNCQLLSSPPRSLQGNDVAEEPALCRPALNSESPEPELS